MNLIGKVICFFDEFLQFQRIRAANPANVVVLKSILQDIAVVGKRFRFGALFHGGRFDVLSCHFRDHSITMSWRCLASKSGW